MTMTMPPTNSLSCSNHLLEQAAQLNADGVLAFQQGQASNAFQSFVSALKSLEQLRGYYHQLEQQQRIYQPMVHRHYGLEELNEPSSAASAGSSSNSPMSGEPPLQIRCQADPQVPPPAPFQVVQVPHMEDVAFYIFKSAVIFPEQAIAVAWPLDSSYEVYQQQLLRRMVQALCFCEGVTLFNLALLYHHRGWNWGDSRAYQDALNIYLQSQARFKAWTRLNRDDPSANAREQVQVLQLAALNNVIHVHFQLAQFGQAQDLVNELLMQSVGALGGQQQQPLPAFLNKPDIDGFLLNALVVRRHNTAPCA